MNYKIDYKYYHHKMNLIQYLILQVLYKCNYHFYLIPL